MPLLHAFDIVPLELYEDENREYTLPLTIVHPECLPNIYSVTVKQPQSSVGAHVLKYNDKFDVAGGICTFKFEVLGLLRVTCCELTVVYGSSDRF